MARRAFASISFGPLLPLLTAAGFAVGASGCTVLAGFLAAQPAPCTAAEDCLTGYACVDGECDPQDRPPGPGAVPLVTYGPEGGTVLGPDGVELLLPAGALGGEVELLIERLTATAALAGVTPRTPVYAVSPATQLLQDATLRIPVPAGACDGSCALYTANALSGTFSRQGGDLVVDGARTYLSAEVRALALFVVGVPPPGEGPGDGGVLDGGVLDGGVLDGGVLDGGGAPGALHDACAFGADDCAPGLTCVADPFEPARGYCLSPAGACGAACVCCAALDATGVSWCLPGALCGNGGPGTSCAAVGTAACDPTTSDACLDVTPGPGAADPVCSSSCSAATEAERCGSGCCVPAVDPSGNPEAGYCAPSAACALPTGALCLSGSSCASGVCAAPIAGEPSRCAEACTPGTCGDGLCCFPTTCEGDGTCVPESLCVSDTLFCTDTCLDDSACPGGLCDRGSCVPSASCECLDHNDCGPSEYCAKDAAVQADCTAAPDAPCCGSCTPVDPGACWADEDCAAPEAPLCAISTDGGCADDPFEQCAGTCQALEPGGCTVDEDCPLPRRCVDHTCL